MNPKKEEILAFECFGSELGQNYNIQSLKTDKQIEVLFDLAQILRATITDIGWKYLFEIIGIKRVYDIDKKSGWFDTEDEKVWIESIYYNSLICGYNPLNGDIGQWDEKSNHFISPDSKSEIDWNLIHSIRL